MMAKLMARQAVVCSAVCVTVCLLVIGKNRSTVNEQYRVSVGRFILQLARGSLHFILLLL